MIRGSSSQLGSAYNWESDNYVFLTSAEYNRWRVRHRAVYEAREGCPEVEGMVQELNAGFSEWRTNYASIGDLEWVTGILNHLRSVDSPELYVGGCLSNAEAYATLDAALVEAEAAVADCVEDQDGGLPSLNDAGRRVSLQDIVQRKSRLPGELVQKLVLYRGGDAPAVEGGLDDDDDESKGLGENDHGVYDVDAGSEASSGWGLGTIAALALGGLAVGLGAAYLKKKGKKGKRR